MLQSAISDLGEHCLPGQGPFNAVTHMCLASLFWNLGKQCRPRSEAAERGV